MYKERIKWIDMVKGISMIFIVLSHSGAPIIYQRIYTPFFLAVLFFVSGYTLNKKKSFKEFLLNKIRTLIVPIVLLGGINILLSYILKGESILYRIKGMLLQINNGNDVMWFVACLFTCEIIFYIILKICKENKKLIIGTSFLLSISGMMWIRFVNIPLVWELELALVMILYLSLGYCYSVLNRKNNYEISIIKVIVCVLIYLVIVFSYNNYVNIHMEQFGNEFIFIISSLLSMTAFIMICKKVKPNKYIMFIGRNTLVYYAFQIKVIKIISICVSKFDINTYISSIIIMFFTCLILSLPSLFINRYLPILVGKKSTFMYLRKD